tara:strand:+ start:1832 stop:2137 length:306 start_codon:yes stop_codon:yes gene_type:complete
MNKIYLFLTLEVLLPKNRFHILLTFLLYLLFSESSLCLPEEKEVSTGESIFEGPEPREFCFDDINPFCDHRTDQRDLQDYIVLTIMAIILAKILIKCSEGG